MSPEFTTGLFTLAGVLLGAVIAYRFTLQLHMRLAKQAAGARLRSVTFEILARTHPQTKIGGTRLDLVMREHFHEQHAAAFGFQHFLPSTERERFGEAWNAYTGTKEGQHGADFQQYDGFDGYKLLEQRLRALLSFTDS